MRKLILISALLLASASAQAGESRSLTLAANDEPKAIETVKPAEPAKVDETKTETVKSDTAKTDTSKAQASKPAKKTHARRWEGDEAKARRIAARYGVYW
jgi:hypothetical protein